MVAKAACRTDEHTVRATCARRDFLGLKSKRPPAQNLLLAALPVCRPAAPPRGALSPSSSRLAPCSASRASRIRDVYFPIDSFISLISPTVGDAALELGLVGDEGMLGISLMLGANVARLQGLVQGAGRAWRVKAAPSARARARSGVAPRLNRYLYVTLIQLTQTATCTRFHSSKRGSPDGYS